MADRDPAVRAQLVALYMPVARQMAKRYSGISEPYDDLLQVASLGLLNAVDRFDPARGIPFLGFAKPTIMGELKRHLRDRTWTVRVPRSIHDLIARLERATEELRGELGRPPSANELARRLDADPVAVLEALEAQLNRRPVSLDAPPKEEDEDGWAQEWTGEEDAGYELAENRLAVRTAIPALDEREAKVLRMRFVDDLPQTRIATEIGCSQMQVSRILRRALDRLRAEIDPA